jgi:hypothetical protein
VLRGATAARNSVPIARRSCLFDERPSHPSIEQEDYARLRQLRADEYLPGGVAFDHTFI